MFDWRTVCDTGTQTSYACACSSEGVVSVRRSAGHAPDVASRPFDVVQHGTGKRVVVQGGAKRSGDVRRRPTSEERRSIHTCAILPCSSPVNISMETLAGLPLPREEHIMRYYGRVSCDRFWKRRHAMAKGCSEPCNDIPSTTEMHVLCLSQTVHLFAASSNFGLKRNNWRSPRVFRHSEVLRP
jgi:hypothetical protein